MDEGGELAANMSRFYSMLRAQMMKAQIRAGCRGAQGAGPVAVQRAGGLG